ncbi:uncharacterized protein DUF4129 [Dinghuibacter silviterrae]|uniref:Uncharacterized protein DUF4129 n=2 Tax=Dinghuibacter silviterrae TaxID=1539049 RepID=A0A4R8DU03_9BACT|nr:uncharacterized protein DUF4129 [Dinghuibacter silviterrae]
MVLCLYAGVARAQDTTTALAPDTTTQTASSDTIWYNQGIAPVHLQPRHVPSGEVDRLRKEEDFRYVAIGPDKQKPPEPKPEHETWWDRFWTKVGNFLSQPWAVFMLWTLLVGVAVAALVAIIQAGSGQSMFRRSRKLKEVAEGEKDIDVIDDPERELEKALEARDYSAAERWLYIRALSGLGERGLIKHHPEKTNRQYLRELRGHPLYDDFAPLLRHYEYTYYGGFAPSAAAFQTIRDQYARFQNRLDTL